MRMKFSVPPIYIAVLVLLLSGCKKMLDIAPPIDSVTTGELFSTNQQAEWAITGIYSKMINGTSAQDHQLTVANVNFAAGMVTILGALSAGEIIPGFTTGNQSDLIASSKVTLARSGELQGLWNSAYRTIYDCSAAIEGLEASKSPSLADSVKKQLLGEALVLRAFAYFNLVNFYGELPLALSTDFNATGMLSRSAVSKVYEQIKGDVKRAIPMLNPDLSVGTIKRIRINRFAAEALLARICLFSGDYTQAITSASNIISQTQLYKLEPTPATVFSNDSKETIFALRAAATHPYYSTTTPESYILNYPPPSATTPSYYQVNPALYNSFEAADTRKTNWFSVYPDNVLAGKHKYNDNIQQYTVFRLAEMYLIRAEATMLSTPSQKEDAVDDLNVLRLRAGASMLFASSMTPQQVTEAIAEERKLELFCEWGHRWSDLKRTGKALDVLPVMTHKMPWAGDFQLLYPIPADEIRKNINLKQNPGYNL